MARAWPLAGRGFVVEDGARAWPLAGRGFFVENTSVTFTITAESGSYSLTGTAASPLFGRLLAAGAGSYALTGTAVDFTRQYVLAVGVGSYALNGSEVTFIYPGGGKRRWPFQYISRYTYSGGNK